jgi:hypothetical protein
VQKWQQHQKKQIKSIGNRTDGGPVTSAKTWDMEIPKSAKNCIQMKLKIPAKWLTHKMVH